MKTFFTSDLHLQSSEHPGIIEWAHRPFKSVAKHDAALIRGINERCKPDDLLIHVGDLMNYGKNRGAEAGRNKPDFYLSQPRADDWPDADHEGRTVCSICWALPVY